MDCIFCKIIAGEIPADILYRDEEITAFRDINPLSPTHVLIIPGKHITSLDDLSGDELSLAGHMIEVANRIALEEGIAKNGYRLVINCGQHGGQIVPHLHMHLLGGRQLSGRLG